MAKNITRTELSKQDFLVLRRSRDGTVTNVIAPNGLQVGLSDSNFTSDLKVKGIIDAEGGLRFSDGTILTTSSTATVIGRTKTQTVLASDYAARATISLGTAARMDTIGADTDSFIDIFHNQKLMLSGSSTEITAGSKDYYIDPGANAVVFSFPVLTNDTISTITISSGSAALTTAGQGLSLTSNVLDIDLATSSGLEFSSSKLQLDLKSGGGLALSSNELFVDISNLTALSSGLDSTNDKLLIYDNSASGLKKVSPSLIAAAYAALDIASVSNALTEGSLATGDLLGVADISASNEVKKITVEDFGQYLAAGTNAGIGESSGKLTIDLNDLSAAAVAVSADSIAIIDAGDNSSKKESIADLMTAVAGTVTSTGLAASSGVLGVDIPNQTNVTAATGDYVLVADASDSFSLKRTTVSSIQSSTAPIDAQYVTLASNGTLSDERVLTAGNGIDITDGGAGSTITIATDLKSSGGLVIDSGEVKVEYGSTSGLAAQGTNTITIVAADGLKSGGTATIGTASTSIQLDVDVADFAGRGLSASGDDLHTYLAAGDNILITTGSDGHLIIGATGLGTGDIAGVTAGTGLSGGGSSGTVSLALDVSELSALGTTADTSDYLVIQDATDNSTKKLLISNLPGDIQGITAGVGLSGGGTSGTVTLTLDVTELTEVGSGASGDFVVIHDVTDHTTKKVQVSNLPGSITDVQVTPGLTGGGASGDIQLGIDNAILATLTGSVFSGHIGVTGSMHSTTTVSGSLLKANYLTGSLTTLNDGSSYLIAGTNISITSGSAGAVTISSSASADQDVFKTISVSGQDNVVADANTDTLTLAAGSNVTITTNAGSDTITIASTDTNTTYSSSDFTHDDLAGFVANEHIDWTANQGGTNIHAGNYADTNTTYTAGDGLDLSGTTFSVDLRSASGLTITSTELDIDDSIIATLSGSVFSGHVGVTGSIHSTTTVSGSILKAQALSGSLTKLVDGSSYIIAGTNVQVATGSTGAITISSTDTNTTYSAGTGLGLSGTTFSVDNAIVATLSGSQFSGNVGITGSFELKTGDFRVESTGEDQALFLDASTNTFYINKGATGFTTIIKNTNNEVFRAGAN